MRVVDESATLAVLAGIGAVLCSLSLMVMIATGLKGHSVFFVVVLVTVPSSSWYVVRFRRRRNKGISWAEGILLFTGSNIAGFFPKQEIGVLEIGHMSGTIHGKDVCHYFDVSDQFFGSHKRLIQFFKQAAEDVAIELKINVAKDRAFVGEAN